MNFCCTSEYNVKFPIGNLKISYCERGIHSIENKTDMTFQQTSLEFSSSALKETILWLKYYFDSNFEATQRSVPSICPSVFISKGEFKGHVWRTLMRKAPPGHTVSYGELAMACGSAGASRAVGTAMATNPLLLVVPCHRVVRANRSIGAFSGGNGIKKWLLTHEGVQFHGDMVKD
ncbi:methylated-DNA--protein-cysteine methyltransferase [Trichonephila clavata]|uniref:Methylated-DNA--protein-cysteine methyltransferase n=1 Tax=Trichonephila clavata TaxID=2740835 RepID=A0A8X6IF66_TRICU|nr:methylated-DNA--protein-cysteine methyltransferase [Trichonephila clavata]